MPERSGRLSTLLDTLWLKASGHSHPRDSSCVAVERAVSTMRETLARMIGRMWKATDADVKPRRHLPTYTQGRVPCSSR